MKFYTDKQIFELCDAIANLERAGQRFCTDFGYENAVEKYRELRQKSSDTKDTEIITK